MGLIRNGRYEYGIGVFWLLNGSYHRDDDLPAYEDIYGMKIWYQYGKLHRTTGPAIELANGLHFWHLNGEIIDCKTQEEFERLMRMKAFW